MIDFITFNLAGDVRNLFTVVMGIGFVCGFMTWLIGWTIGWFYNLLSKAF